MRRVTPIDPERGIVRVLLACACLSLLVTGALLLVLLLETAQLLRHAPLLELLLGAAREPAAAGGQPGLLPLAAGTLLVTATALAVALPAGLLGAVYLSEYAPAAVRRAVAPLLVLLAAVPTVVYGYFALRFVTPQLQRVLPGLADGNALSPGIVAGIMIMPMVTALSVDALQGVPQGLREAARALGATRAQAVLRVVLPAAGAGIGAGRRPGRRAGPRRDDDRRRRRGRGGAPDGEPAGAGRDPGRVHRARRPAARRRPAPSTGRRSSPSGCCSSPARSG